MRYSVPTFYGCTAWRSDVEARHEYTTGEGTGTAARESDRNSRHLLDSIPGLVALLSATGELEFCNRQILEYTGRTLEELKHWGTDDTVHPEDLPHVIQVFTQSIGSGNSVPDRATTSAIGRPLPLVPEQRFSPAR